MEDLSPQSESLCFPDGKRSCIGCCPPIRPAGYDHLDHRSIIRRILLENTRTFERQGGVRPITGYSCWAMGYLDRDLTLPGCLLHPAQNNGKDMRHRVDFGDKCRRELCEEAKVFDSLSAKAKKACKALASTLDSFEYSSRRTNPLFRLLGWGEGIVNALFEGYEGPMDWEELIQIHPLLSTAVNPRAFRYLAEGLVSHRGIEALRKSAEALETFFREAALRTAYLHPIAYGGSRPHLLDLPRAFSDFLRLGAGISSITLDKASRIKGLLDELITEARL
jgi:hypothetical protein